MSISGRGGDVVGSLSFPTRPSSDLVVLAVALLVTAGTAAPATFTVSVTASESPTATGPACARFTVAPVTLATHPAPATPANARPAGSGSAIRIESVVAALPTFTTVS